MDATGVKIQPILLGLIYSNVVEKTGGLPGAPPVGFALPPGVLPVATATGTDKGQIWLKGDAKLNFVFNRYFSGTSRVTSTELMEIQKPQELAPSLVFAGSSKQSIGTYNVASDRVKTNLP